MRISRTTLRLLLVTVGLLAILALYVPTELPSNDWFRTVLLVFRALVLVMVPGGAILSFLHHSYEPDEALALVPILSLALFPVVLLLCTTVGLSLSKCILRALLVGGLIYGMVRSWRRAKDVNLALASTNVISVLVLILIFFVTLTVRLYQIRGIAYPAGGDSYHHTLITRLIMMFGQVPSSYEPLVNISSFTYHFGYHTYSAFLGWIGGIEPHRAVLWGGQFLNALTVPSIWFLAKRITHNSRVAVAASVMAGLICMMPAYYVNWGRYTQLFGQVVLLPALGLLYDALATEHFSWKLTGLAALLSAGVGLGHYRVAIFYLVGALLIGVTAFVSAKGKQRLKVLLKVLVIAIIALMLISPWLPAFLQKTVSSAEQVAAADTAGQYDYLSLDFVLSVGLRPLVFIITVLCMIYLVVRPSYRVQTIVIICWFALVWFLANSELSGIPDGFITNGTLILALYMPASLLVGLALGDLAQLIEHHVVWACSGWIFMCLTLLIWGALGVCDKLDWGVNRAMFWVTDNDLEAMTWIEENTSADSGISVFLKSWQIKHTQADGSGWWVEYITGRHTLVWPLVYINEVPGEKLQSIDKLGWTLIDAQDADEYAAAMERAGLDYVYENSSFPILTGDSFANSDLFELVYQNDTVAIYALN